jgi:hypothetical protein
MLTYTINQFNDNGFIITYNFNIVGLRPINFSFVYDCMSPFSFKQINRFTDNTINKFNFTDNIYYTNNSGLISLTYYMHYIEYNLDESAQIIDTLKQTLQDIMINKFIIACSITQNNKFIDNIKNGNLSYFIDNEIKLQKIYMNNKSTLYYAIYYKQYNIIEWLLNNNVKIEFQDLEFSDETSRNMILHATQCPHNIINFIESFDSIDYKKRKNESQHDDYHSKIKCI